jgi:flagellar biosynthesis/type III secretory pathway protein FliH
MHGINKWQEEAFEKLGWMVLAKEKGYNEKISAYKKMIDHLLKTITHVKSEYESANRKHDLNVIHMNVECLKDFVKKNL